MPKFFPQVFITGVVLFLLLGAGYGLTTLQARSIPWDCADWQAFAHSDRTTAILESLAENRGKTLYCGVDQSDTFTKAETWEAGKDRNERDDTVYFGERGIFRGFIAAQEGYLTDGESGVTGVSIDRIFEFPREERRYKRVKRFRVGTDADQFPINAAASCDEVLGLICSAPGRHSDSNANLGTSHQKARRRVTGVGNGASRTLNWRTQVVTNSSGSPVGSGPFSTDQWLGWAETKAEAACRARGARYVADSADFGRGHSENRGNIQANDPGPYLGVFFSEDLLGTPDSGPPYRHTARQSRTWEGTCKKVIRRTRK